MSEMNLEQARFNMVEQQIRPWETLDQRVLDLMMEIPRDQFVPEIYSSLAYADIMIPLEHDQVMMPPKVEARLLQALQIQRRDIVLEIGTGSGFLTALLAKLAKRVISVDLYGDFIRSTGAKLKRQKIYNVALEQGDAINGWKKENQFNVIVLTGSVPTLKLHFQKQLRKGGRLFAIVGESPLMEAQVITRVDDDQWDTETVFETDLPALMGSQTADFTF